MRFLTPLAALGLVMLAVSPAWAQPCADVELAFEPDTVSVLDHVDLSLSLANPGDEGGMMEIAVTLSWNDASVGPFTGHVYFAAGREIHLTASPVVPHPVPPGDLGVSITVKAGDCTDTADATLTILDGDPEATEIPDLAAFAASILTGLNAPVEVRPTTWGRLKRTFD
jgi:hypothetical protein